MILNHKGSDIEYIRHYEKPYFIFFTKLKWKKIKYGFLLFSKKAINLIFDVF